MDERDGVVIDWADLRRLDTREMAWEDFDGLAGTRIKVLSADERGNPMVFLQWIPPGGFPSVELPHRHYHSTVREFAYVLDGDLPHWEYASADGPGEMVVYKQGFFMNRLPGSIHGLEPGPTSQVGCTVLFWRDGVGTMVDEPEFASEGDRRGPLLPPRPRPPRSVTGPWPDGGVVLDRPDVTLLDHAARCRGRTSPACEGARVKILLARRAGQRRDRLALKSGCRRGRSRASSCRTATTHTVRSASSASWSPGSCRTGEYRNAEQQQGETWSSCARASSWSAGPGACTGSRLEDLKASATGCVLLQWRDGVRELPQRAGGRGGDDRRPLWRVSASCGRSSR